MEEILRRFSSGDEPIAVEIPRRPGQKEPRWTLASRRAEALASQPSGLEAGTADPPVEGGPPPRQAMEAPSAALEARVDELERRVQALDSEVRRLRSLLED